MMTNREFEMPGTKNIFKCWNICDDCGYAGIGGCGAPGGQCVRDSGPENP